MRPPPPTDPRARRPHLVASPQRYLVLLLWSCGGDDAASPGGTQASDPTSWSDTSANGAEDDAGSSPDGDDDGDGAMSSGPADGDGTTAGATEGGDDDGPGTDTMGAGAGPIELYRGPVLGGSLDGWDPRDPQPLLMMGRQGSDWIATLARVGDDGALSDNVTEELVVWGWAAAPPVLYDGPVVGGVVPGWSADAPIPVVMLGRLDADASWVATLASIGPDGALGDNVADRIVVWGFPDGTPESPTLAYAGPIDAAAVLPGWDPDEPVPLVMLGATGAAETWVATLARIGPGGELDDNFATELRVWGW